MRLGVADHRNENAAALSFELDGADRDRIMSVLARSTDLLDAIGDCGDEYR